MDESKRSKVIAEFVKDDPVVAADLLERLRTRGVVPPTASSAQAVSSAATAPAASVSANEPGSSPTRTDP
jgi:hypothetical protein